ncbi:MAG: ABC transporter permease [Candidatus Pacearchaeota archaeon]
MITDFLKLGVNNLRRRRLRSWLTMLGIIIGVAAVISLISLGNGLKAAVNSQFGIASTEIISVQAGGLNNYGPPGSGAVKPLTMDDLEAIENLNTVERAVRRNIRSGKLEFNDITIYGYGASIPDGDAEFIYEQTELEPEVGRLLKDGDRGKVALGYNFYDDKVGLNKKVVPGNKVIVQGQEFEVVGITKKKGSFILDNVVYINDEDMKDLFDYGDEVDLIAVQVKDKSLVEKAKEDIEKLMRERRDVKEGEEDFSVSTPEASLESVNKILTGVQVFIVIIALISIFVGAIGIVNTMTTSVLERKTEIGTMKAIGAKNSQIFLIFLIESGLIGLIGGAIGILLGIGMGYAGTNALNNFLGATTKPSIDFMLIGLSLAGSFIVGAASGIAPALRAANQNPVDALRG